MSHPTEPTDFEAVVMPHLEAVYRMARRLARSPELAEDLVQETYLRALRAFESFQLREYGAKPWLMKILHNCFYTRVGREAKGPSLIEDSNFDGFAETEPTPEAPAVIDGAIDWEQFDDRIKDAVESLPSEFAEVLLLWAMEELSYKEIAAVCDVPMGTVMSRLHRARNMLGDKLVDFAREHGTPGA